jgi:hypothetical protein
MSSFATYVAMLAKSEAAYGVKTEVSFVHLVTRYRRAKSSRFDVLTTRPYKLQSVE